MGWFWPELNCRENKREKDTLPERYLLKKKNYIYYIIIHVYSLYYEMAHILYVTLDLYMFQKIFVIIDVITLLLL